MPIWTPLLWTRGGSAAAPPEKRLDKLFPGGRLGLAKTRRCLPDRGGSVRQRPSQLRHRAVPPEECPGCKRAASRFYATGNHDPGQAGYRAPCPPHGQKMPSSSMGSPDGVPSTPKADRWLCDRHGRPRKGEGMPGEELPQERRDLPTWDSSHRVTLAKKAAPTPLTPLPPGRTLRPVPSTIGP